MSLRSTWELPGYKYIKHLGTGAHATICLALDTQTGRKVAIKRVIRNGPEDDKFINQAENEFAVASRLHHESLRAYYDVIRVRKWLKIQRLYLIMEFAEGDTLEHHPPTRLARVPAIFIHVAQGLHAMHAQGFVHTDIKPNNIILHSRDQVKIIDFGQSCPLGQAKQRVQGTPDYMAPEQVRRLPLDQRTDIFNLGATMYWVVTRRPFATLMPTHVDKTKLVDLRSARENPPPHELNPRVPKLLSQLILRCCEFHPANRPRDMRDVIAALEAVDHLIRTRRTLPGPGDD